MEYSKIHRASERVLPACRAIHYTLQNDLGVDNYVGATLGKAYCGVVGGVKRHEFAVLGPSVNLSARLLSMPNHPGILIDEVVDFMVKVFNHCTSHADLTIVALDDMQYIDNLSWKVIQRIYERGENILFVCGSRPLGSRIFTDDDFWKNLYGAQRQCGRFQELKIGPLNRVEVTQMIAISLSCKVEELDEQFAKDIFNHTRGMPHFANQALVDCKRKGLCKRLKNKKIGWSTRTEVRCLIICSLVVNICVPRT